MLTITSFSVICSLGYLLIYTSGGRLDYEPHVFYRLASAEVEQVALKKAHK